MKSNASSHYTLHNHNNDQSKQMKADLKESYDIIVNDTREIRDYLRHTRQKIDGSGEKNKQNSEWKQVALVLDRLLFYLYILANIVSFNLMFNKLFFWGFVSPGRTSRFRTDQQINKIFIFFCIFCHSKIRNKRNRKEC